MSKRIETTAKEHYALLEQSLVCDLRLSDLDFRIVALALCRTMGVRTANRIVKFNASGIARTLGGRSRNTIAASLKRLEKARILEVITRKNGNATGYGLRLDPLGNHARSGSDLHGNHIGTGTETEHPSATAESRKENIKSDSPTEQLDSPWDSSSSYSSRSAPESAMTCSESEEVGAGIAGDRTEVWAREHLNNLGGYYYEGYEPGYRALIEPRGVQGFIDAVYLYGLRLDRGTQFKKPPEAWIRAAVLDGYKINKADRDTIAAEQLATEIPF